MKNYLLQISAVLLIVSIGMVSCRDNDVSNKNGTLDLMQQKDSVVKIASAAFNYGLPLILLDITQSQLIASDTLLNLNTFLNNHQFSNSSDTSVIRPNADTYYSVAWLNLSGGPVLMTLPKTDTIYYQMPMLDGFTNVIYSPGTRTGQTEGGTYVITGSNENIASQNVSDTINAVAHYKSNTDMVWVLGRFEVDNDQESEIVINLQNQLNLKLLGEEEDYDNPIHIYKTGTPNDIVTDMDIDTFFNRMNTLLINNPPAVADSSIVASMKKIGIGAGLTFDSANFPKAEKILKNIPSINMSLIETLSANSNPILDTSNWTVNLDSQMGNYGISYQLRAIIAYAGLGANTIEDAVYYSNDSDNDDNPLTSNYSYTLIFDKDATPPVDAFWSLTMYNEDGYFVDNSIDRYAVGHGAPFHYNEPDSTLTLYIQSEQPTDANYYNNWLPSDSLGSNFNVMLRAYWPKQAILDTLWAPPNIVKNNDIDNK